FLNKNYNEKEYKNKDLYFNFNDIESLTRQYRGFDIEPINREASILDISLKGSNIKKSVNFLNKLTMNYLEQGLEKKNQIAINTINFIDSELGGIVKSLQVVEQTLQDYRTEKIVMNLDFQSQEVYKEMKELQNKKATMEVHSMYYRSLRDYLQSKQDVNALVVPSSVGIDSPLLTELISGLTELYNTRIELLYTSTEKNPSVLSLERQIQSIKKAILENISNIINSSTLAIDEIDIRISKLSDKINYLPKTQRDLISIQRAFDLNDAIYTYLLERRSEAQITKASNVTDNEIIDKARTSGHEPVYPKNSLNYTIAIILGLVLPAIYILGKDYFNDKIIERKDIENITNLP
ncbi:MAG: hypothetical protein KAT33_00805, partial [Bacteroidales bacterium]|nr:hypothetical protein [Bacteroidales bacterium]